MVKTSDKQASVKWGGDETYTVPALTTADFNGVSRVFKASTLKRLPSSETDKHANAVCSNSRDRSTSTCCCCYGR